MSPHALGYEVWFSDDDERGRIVAAIQRVEPDGQTAWVGDREFQPYDDWSNVASWIWFTVSEDMPVSLR